MSAELESSLLQRAEIELYQEYDRELEREQDFWDLNSEDDPELEREQDFWDLTEDN